MNDSAHIDERIAGIKRVITCLEQQRCHLFDTRKQQPKQYKLIISEINDAKQRIQKLIKIKGGES